MDQYSDHLSAALPAVRERVAAAALRTGRDPEGIRLVAVTKGHPVIAIQAALTAGLTDLGENRVEALEEKVPEVGRSRATWHMIGSLQSRKAPRVVGLVDWIHSVDSMKLARRLARASEEAGAAQPVLVQVNVSGEEAKSGFRGAELLDRLGEMAELSGLAVKGLMTMAPFVEDEGVLRQSFRGLRELRDEAAAYGLVGEGELSMGMSNDFELAVEEGSTMIRLGTVLFGRRPA